MNALLELIEQQAGGYKYIMVGIRQHTQYGNRTNRIRPEEPIISLLFPILPGSLDLPTRHFVFLYIFSYGYI